MEEDTGRVTLNLNSKRRSKRRSSSILKTTAGPLLDIDPNKRDGYTIPLKKPRQSLSRRVSFAKLLEVKEFPRDSPRRWEDSPAQPPAIDTGNDTIPVTDPVSGQQDQHVVTNVSEVQHDGSRLPLLPGMSAPDTQKDLSKPSQYLVGQSTPAMVETCVISGTGSGQPQQWTQASKIDGSSLLKSLVGTGTLPRQGVEYNTQVREESGLTSKTVARDTKIDGMALLQALGDGGGSNMSTEPELLSTYKSRESTTEQSAATNRTMVFSEYEYMDQTEALTCHIQLREAEACLKGLRQRTPLMALKDQTPCDVRYGVLNNEPGDKTIVFSLGDDMQQTEVLPAGLHLNSRPCDGELSSLSGPVNRQSLLQSLGGSDETDSPEVLFAKKFETLNATMEKPSITQDYGDTLLQHNVEESRIKGYDIAHQREPTLMFQGLEMEETGVINIPIDMQGSLSGAETPEDRNVLFYVGSNSEEIKAADNPMYRHVEQKSENKTLIYQDGADMEQTGVIDSQITNRSLAQRPVNQTLMDGADMEETELIPNNILSNRSTLQQSGSKTLIFQDGADMEETGLIPNNVLSNKSIVQQSGSKTLIFQDGADMEQTGVIDSQITNRSLAQRPVNQTLMDGADMEETGVIPNNILSNKSIVQQSGSKTLIFQDGADMEQTGVIDSKIANRSLAQRPVNQTLMDGADMEETELIPNNILSNRSTLQQSGSKTLIFQDGADMEETGLIPNNVLSNKSIVQQSGSKTLIFQDGADMEQTGVIDSQITNRSLAQRPVNQTLMDGADMEETGVIPNNILSNKSIVQQSGSKTLIFQDGADMEQTGVIDSKIANRSLAQRPVNQTLMDGADMEETELIPNNILSNRSTLQQSGSKTLIFQDGADMEETGLIPNNVLSNKSIVQQSGSKTLIFQDGADMEQTGVIDSQITNRSLAQRPVNQTLMDGADMEQTGVIDSQITNKSLAQRPVNQTLMDGVDMEQTGVIDSQITNKSLAQRPVNQTLMDGADMEQTGVIDSQITNKSLALRPVNQTLMDGADMEQTGVIPNNILSNRSTLQQSGSKTLIFQDGADMEQTGVIDSKITNKSLALRPVNQTLMDGADMEQTGVIPNNILSNRSTLQQSGSKTLIFQDGADMEQTGVIDSKITNRSLAQRPVNQTLMDGADMEETGLIPNNILSNRSTLQQSGSKTLIFQDGADMEETGLIPNNILSNKSIVQQSGSKTLIFQDGADMEQTGVIDSQITNKSLAQRPVNQTLMDGADMEQTGVIDSQITNKSLAQRPVNQTLMDGADMEQTGVIDSQITNKSLALRPVNQTLMDGADMEQTGVIPNNILSNRSTLQQSGSKTLIFQDGADMEQTGVIDSKITNKSLALRPVNQTLMDGADMEQTGVIPNNILSNRSTLQQSGSKTLIFQDGADMEQTGVIDSKITNRSLAQRPVNQTLMDGADMEQTGVIDSQITNRSLAQRPVNQTLMDGADMEQTGVIPNNILSNRSTLQQSGSKTLIFQDGADMEQTGVIDSKITNKSLAQRPVNQTLMDGADMEQTGVIPNNILSNRSTLQQSGSKTLIFQDGADMEQTGVIDSQITNKSLAQRPVNQTLMDGADMEQTGVIDSQITNRSLAQRPVNQTLMDGADMEQTGVIDSQITNRSLAQRPVNQTLMDGADMEQTGVIPNNILSNRSTLQQSGSKTLIFQDGADMEQTGVIDSKITNRSLAQRPVNQTLMDGADMEQTGVIDSQITNKSLAQRPVNQTLMDGADMEQTGVLESKITNRSFNIPHKLVTCSTKSSEEFGDNKTVVFTEGVDLDETHATTSNIKIYGQGIEQASQSLGNMAQHQDVSKLNKSNKSSLTASARLKRLSARFSLGGDNVTGRLSLAGDNLTSRLTMTGESEVDSDQTPSIPRNTIRLAGPTPRKDDEKACDVTRECSEMEVSLQVTGDSGSVLPQTSAQVTGVTPQVTEITPQVTGVTPQATEVTEVTGVIPQVTEITAQVTGVTAQVAEVTPQTTDMETEEPYSCLVIDDALSLDTNSKQTGEMDIGITEVLPPLDLDLTDMLPPGDIVTSSLQTSTMTDLPVLNKTKDRCVEQNDRSGSDSSQIQSGTSYSSGSDSSQTQSGTSYSIVCNYSNYSMTETMLETTRREVDGPLTVKKLCLLLDIPCLNWLESQIRNDRCSILPEEQVDTSDLRNVLRACAVQCPFYLVHSHIYTQAVRQADLKKEKAEELDILFTQEDSKPELFRAVGESSEQQRKTLRGKVWACSKVSLLLGKTHWKNVRAQATVQYRETLKEQYSRLQTQASDVSTALHQSQGLLAALDTAWSDLEAEESDQDSAQLPSDEEIQQWYLAQQELSVKVADLHQLEEEQTKLTSDRDSIHSELAILRDRDQQSICGQRQNVKQVLENLESEDTEVTKDLDWMKRCLEWRPDRCEQEAVSYLLYEDSLLLETTLDTSHQRRLLSATLTSTLPDRPSKPVSHFADKSEDIMGLMHRLIIKSVKEQNILTKFIGTPLKEQYKFLRAVSMIVCTGRCLAQEVTRIEFNNWVTIQEQGLSVEFWCDEARRKIDIDFDLKLKYRDYSASPSVRVDIGNFRPEDVQKQLNAVPDVGFRYFERLCQAINLNDMAVIPEMDRCS